MIIMFYVLLTMRLVIILVTNQHNAQFFSVYVYFDTLHISRNYVLIIRIINCINTTSGIFYVYGSVHHNIFYEITNRCSYMQ